MRTILIDPAERSISVHEYNGDWQTIAPTLGCETFDIVGLDCGDLYIDDEGLMKPNEFFIIEGFQQPLAGRSLLFGAATEDGDSTGSSLLIEQLEVMVQWISHDRLLEIIDEMEA
jgi:hypothetical protein